MQRLIQIVKNAKEQDIDLNMEKIRNANVLKRKKKKWKNI